MRNAWLPLGLALLGGVAGPLACGQAFVVTGGAGAGGGSSTSAAGPSGGGGGDTSTSNGGSTPTSGATSSTGTGMIAGPPCATVADCATSTNSLCGEVICVQNHCVTKPLQGDGKLFSQLYGDCLVAKCSKAHLVNDVSDSDVYDDGNECTDDTCKNGVPSNAPKVGAKCGTKGVCNAKGACVECLNISDGQCGGTTPTCINNTCSAATCQDMQQDFSETDEDCGGDACGPCDAGKLCNTGSDCKSKVCDLPAPNAPEKQCLIAICSDGVKNGSETDVDCGGSGCPAANKCAATKHCALPGDCQSGVCQSGVCQKPACNDGVKNGMEVGIDCGGGAPGCAVKCPGG
jgi:hypothetical protein